VPWTIAGSASVSVPDHERGARSASAGWSHRDRAGTLVGATIPATDQPLLVRDRSPMNVKGDTAGD
jgi:hypothetical protein